MAVFGQFKYGEGVYVPSIGSRDQAGVTHNIVLDGTGLMTQGVGTRSDITSAIPRISIGAEQRQHTDFSERDTFGQKSSHHGFGEVEFSDRAKFYASEGINTSIPNQMTLQPLIYTHNFSDSADGSSAFTDTNGYITAATEFQGNTYVLQQGDVSGGSTYNNKLMYWDESTDTWIKSAATASMSTASASVPTDLQTFGVGANVNLYITQGEATNMVRFNSNLSTVADNGVPARFIESFAGKLWRADNLNEIYYSVDPHTDGSATWTALEDTARVGDSTYFIRGMTVHDNALWVGKDDGIYKIAANISSTNDDEKWYVQKVIDLSHSLSPYNGAAMMSFGGSLYFSVDKTLGQWDGTTLQFMGPDRGANPGRDQMQIKSVYDTALPQSINTEPTTFNAGAVGHVVSITNDGENIYVAVDTGGNSTGGSGLESRVMYWNRSGWHNFYSTNEYSSTAHEGGDYRTRFVHYIPKKGNAGWSNYPRIMISNEAIVNEEEDGVEKEDRILQAYFPRWGSNPLDDVDVAGLSNIAYRDKGYLITSWFDGGLPDILKTFFDLTIETQDVGLGIANNNIKVEYQVDDLNIWNTIHQSTTIGASDNDLITHTPTQTLTFPDNGNLDRSIYAKKIRLKFTLTRATSGTNYTLKTPILKSWGYHFVVRPESRYGWKLTVKCFDNLIDLQRRQESKQGQELRQFLYGLRDQKVPITFSDGTELDQIKNWVTNPSMEYLTGTEGTPPVGYTASGSAITSTTQYRAHGSRALVITPSASTGDASVTIGTYDLKLSDNVFIAANMYVPDGADSVYLQVIKTSDSSILLEKEFTAVSPTGAFGDIYLANKTRWVRGYAFHETVTDASNYTFKIIRKSADAHTTSPFYVDTVEFAHNGPNNLKIPNYDYVDGDQLRCRWLGSPHNSESVRQSGYQVYITGMTESFRYPEVKQSNTRFDSEITLALREVS